VQEKIEITLPGIAVPFIGFVDVGWTKHGIRLDIKTKLRSVTAIEEAHNRQVSLYLHGTNMTGRVCYITPKDAEIFTLENPAQYVEQARQIALRIQNFLSLTDDTDRLIASVVPNYGSFYWDAASRSTGKEVFGI
jgi:translation elongation factor EF-Ts